MLESLQYRPCEDVDWKPSDITTSVLSMIPSKEESFLRISVQIQRREDAANTASSDTKAVVLTVGRDDGGTSNRDTGIDLKLNIYSKCPPFR